MPWSWVRFPPRPPQFYKKAPPVHLPKLTLRRKILLLVVLPLTLAIYLIQDHFIEDGNFDIAVPGTVYRSATLSHHEWKEVYRKHLFKSVINLRGESPAADWYRNETASSARNGIDFYSLKLSANRQPDITTMETLVEMMRAAPKPVLIHCMQGADRTGLALALYSYAIEGQPATVAASRNLSILFGHFPWLASRTGAMDKAFAAYVQAHPQTPAVPHV